ncbi:MAG: cyclic nucleotide-binding domain-containing protein [Gammaproteobacteria bacterium]|nr:cyclic nucleotide-binding domain-containing protein [Gammaproteobacteria bacterium]MDH5799816.1 cyclic nucleotide-binding domain-containing protein [Gammaproteobacteria bacterium]
MQTDAALNNLELLGQGSAFCDELCSMLEQMPMFRDLTRPEVEILSGYVQAFEAESGKTLFLEGEKGGFMCFLVSGKIDVIKESHLRERKTITTVRPGQTIGEMSLLDDMPFSATACAVEKTTVILITRRNFESFTEDHPALAIKMIRKVARLISLRLRQTTGILADYI